MPKPDKPVVVALFPEEGIAEAPSHVAVQVLALWNEYAERVNAAAGETIWEGATALTVKRRRRINVATKDYGGLHAMRGYLEKAAQNNFLLKQTKRIDKFKDWKPNFDWFLHEDTIVKFIENRFKANTMSAEDRKADPSPVNWRARLDAYKRAGFWLPSDGPRPEEPGPHKAPAEMITEWRTRTNLPSLKPVPVESAEDRLRATLGMYEARGRSEDAARIRVKLATLLGHPQEARQEGAAAAQEAFSSRQTASSPTPILAPSPLEEPPTPGKRDGSMNVIGSAPQRGESSTPTGGNHEQPHDRGTESRPLPAGQRRGVTGLGESDADLHGERATRDAAKRRDVPALSSSLRRLPATRAPSTVSDALRLGPHDEEPPPWDAEPVATDYGNGG